eukprot:scaffold18800_cov18-Tisochrysis_lutea.AAC.1
MQGPGKLPAQMCAASLPLCRGLGSRPPKTWTTLTRPVLRRAWAGVAAAEGAAGLQQHPASAAALTMQTLSSVSRTPQGRGAAALEAQQ